MYTNKHNAESIDNKKLLYIIFAVITACGLASVYIYNKRPRVSLIKLLATALIEAKSRIIQNKAFHVAGLMIFLNDK